MKYIQNSKHYRTLIIVFAMLLPQTLTLSCAFKVPDEPVLGYEFDDVSCSDGQDNDQDKQVDCEDIDCVEKSTVCGAYIPFDPILEDEVTIELCNDGQDNDDDGSFDCGDQKCKGFMQLCCLREFDDESCSDGIDNDLNGFTD
jgi:hypothetical protein